MEPVDKDETWGDLYNAYRLGLLNSLDGKTFCTTGTLSIARKGMVSLIHTLGGVYHDTMEATTQYLIIPSHSGVYKGSTYQAAVRLGKVILSEEEFCSLILPTLDKLLGGNDGTEGGQT